MLQSLLAVDMGVTCSGVVMYVWLEKRYGWQSVKVLWCRFYLVRLVFWDFIPTWSLNIFCNFTKRICTCNKPTCGILVLAILSFLCRGDSLYPELSGGSRDQVLTWGWNSEVSDE